MKLTRLIQGAASGAAVCALVFASACTSQSANSGVDRPYTVGSTLYTRPGAAPAKPAPAPKAEPAKPASKPAARGGCSPIVGPDQTVTSQAFPTGELGSSAIVVHTVMPREVRLGQPYEYQLQVCNLTSGELQNVVVTSENTSNFEMTSSNPSASKGADGSPQWVLGNLAGNDMQIITVTGKADAAGISSNCVGVSYNNLLCAETKVVEPALALTKTATGEALVCDPIQLTYVVKNSGTGACDNVVVNDKLPEGLTTADGKNTVSFNAGTLAAGQSKEFKVSAKASKPGKYTSAATATSGCGVDASATAVSTIVRQPNLAIKATCGDRIFLGRDVTFTFDVTNSGDAACNNTVISAPVPSGSTFVSADNGGQLSGNSVVWNVGTISAEGGKRTVNMTVTPAGIGNLRASATAECVCAAQVSDSCETSVQGIPAILLEVVDTPDPIAVGESVTYIITVTNQGSATDTDIKVVCEMPGELTFVSAGGATSGSVSGQTITFAPLGSLPPKAAATFRVVVKANKPGNIRFKTSMTSAQFQRPIEETEATNLYE